jgi:serine kinase of HPr protein (carbohydrate metabolism regulator)
MQHSANVHGTALVLDDCGLLLRGPSGAGKSLLALALIERCEGRGETAMLVSDDRVDLIAEGDGIIMQAPQALAGLIELRGRGIVSRPHLKSARLDLVVDLVPDLVRMLEPSELETELLGHPLARAPVPQGGVVGLDHQQLLVLEAVRASVHRTRT